MDCYAWGEAVATAYATATAGDYTTSFNGTSAASAIVAACRGGDPGHAARRTPGAPLQPPATAGVAVGAGNTPQRPASDTRRIGRMPDLAVIATQIGAVDCGDADDGDADAGGTGEVIR